jgi:glycine/D-amino acid oxidase-like deaminating enzyme
MTLAGDTEGLVFLGGGLAQAANAGIIDFDSVDDSSMNKPALEHLCSVLPGYFRAGQGTVMKQAWTGIMGFTPDSFPLVGTLSKDLSGSKVVEGASGHEWIAAGFSGYGMVHCWQSGRAIADMVSGQPMEAINDYLPAELFECSRKRMESLDSEGLGSVFPKSAPSVGSRL